MDRYRTMRDDGRSDRQVVYDYVRQAQPDDQFTYDELISELQKGVDVDIERSRVHRAVSAANPLLLEEDRRYLAVMRGRGYRVIRPEEHLPVAVGKKSKAMDKLAQGVNLLRHVRIGELTEAQRLLHQGQLQIMAGLYDAVAASEERHDRQEAVIERIKAQQQTDIQKLSDRLDALERREQGDD